MSCHIHGIEKCSCPAYLIVMGQMDAHLERELESLPAAACGPPALRKPRPKLLDLFCCAGGAAMGYFRAGFDVTGVDIKPQPRYPFTFIQADALEYAAAHGHEFDAIHASPPCQKHTALAALQSREYACFIAGTREILERLGLPYVIENVIGAPLRSPVILCGSSFGLKVWRHRLFEASFEIPRLACRHKDFPSPIDVSGTGARRLGPRKDGKGGNSRKPRSLDEAQYAMKIHWMNRRELSQAVPPAYTELIGRELMRLLQGGRLAAAAGENQ